MSLTTLSRVKAVLAETLDVDKLTIDDDCCQDNSPNWDSVVSMMFVLGLEREFGVSIDLDDAVKCINVRRVAEILDNKYLT